MSALTQLYARAGRRRALLAGAAALVLIALAWAWYVLTELDRVRSAALSALARQDVPALYALTAPREREGLRLTTDAMRAMLQETLWSRGAAKPDRASVFIAQKDRGRMDYLVTWADGAGNPVRFPVKLLQEDVGPDRLYSSLSFRKRDDGWRLNFTQLIWSSCAVQVGLDPAGRQWYGDLCRRTGVTGHMREDGALLTLAAPPPAGPQRP